MAGKVGEFFKGLPGQAKTGYGQHGRSIGRGLGSASKALGFGTLRSLSVSEVSRQFYFSIEVGGVTLDQFTKVTGFRSEVEVEYIKEGGVNYKKHSFVKGIKQSRLVLEKGLTSGIRLWEWYEKVTNGVIEKKDIVIHLKDERGQNLSSWTIKQAYPVKWEVGQLDSLRNGVTPERVEFEHEGIRHNKLGVMDYLKKGVGYGAMGIDVIKKL